MSGPFRVRGSRIRLVSRAAGLLLAIALTTNGLRGADCNGNAVDDSQDIVAGTSQDCDGDRIPDLERGKTSHQLAGAPLPYLEELLNRIAVDVWGREFSQVR